MSVANVELPLNMLSRPKSRNVAAILALMGILIPGLHKFYLGQPLWGLLYLLLLGTPIPHIASAFDVVWYLAQNQDEFDRNFNFDLVPTRKSAAVPVQVNALAEAMRQLDSLRQDGLISEYEFEQKRRQMLDRMV